MQAVMHRSMNASKLIPIYLNTSECGLKNYPHLCSSRAEGSFTLFKDQNYTFPAYTVRKLTKDNKLYTIFCRDKEKQ
jgi:hypothetical protein